MTKPVRGPYLEMYVKRWYPSSSSVPTIPARITAVTKPESRIIDRDRVPTYISLGGSIVKDIYEVLRKKQAEQAQLGKQIEALQTAAEQLRSVAHLLNEEEAHGEGAAIGG